MNREEVLITGASGEVGQSLVRFLSEEGRYQIVAFDLKEPPPELSRRCKTFYRGNILDANLIDEIEAHHNFAQIFHLAGLLSATGEKNPKLAHLVNVDGSLNIFKIASKHSLYRGSPVTMLFTSSIAAYGLNWDDYRLEAVTERQYLTPVTMYGINKLYIEQLGRYYAVPGSGDPRSPGIDFRCLRFPGLISPLTLPSGGTSDYAPEMLHAAAQGIPYACFVEERATLPFMVMSDAVKSLVDLSRADRARLKHNIYNVTAFSQSADQLRRETLKYFPDAQITFQPDPVRQLVVDSWPDFLNDTPARHDWDWKPDHGLETAFSEVLIPRIRERYRRD